MNVRQELSGTLMISNLLAKTLVISIHYKATGGIDISNGYDWNYLTQQFLTNGVARVAVPFFAMISGFLVILAFTCSKEDFHIPGAKSCFLIEDKLEDKEWLCELIRHTEKESS